MKLKINEIKGLVYSDLFDFPLTLNEIRTWAVYGEEKKEGISFKLRDIELIKSEQGYYFLKGREKLIKLRKDGENISAMKLAKLTELVKMIKKVPMVEGIFVTGSVAAQNSRKEADLDLMIITSENLLWLTRLVVVGILKSQGSYRKDNRDYGDKVCTNIFLDTNNLKIMDRNLYSAHEVLLAKCIFDRGGIQKKWIESNSWTKEFLPAAYSLNKAQIRNGLFIRQFSVAKIVLGLLIGLEIMAFAGQYAYMKRKITNERIGWGFAFFHPKNLSLEVSLKFELALSKVLA